MSRSHHTDMNTHAIKQFFTEEQWDMIYDALIEYEDHSNIDLYLLGETIHQISDLFIED